MPRTTPEDLSQQLQPSAPQEPEPTPAQSATPGTSPPSPAQAEPDGLRLSALVALWDAARRPAGRSLRYTAIENAQAQRIEEQLRPPTRESRLSEAVRRLGYPNHPDLQQAQADNPSQSFQELYERYGNFAAPTYSNEPINLPTEPAEATYVPPPLSRRRRPSTTPKPELPTPGMPNVYIMDEHGGSFMASIEPFPPNAFIVKFTTSRNVTGTICTCRLCFEHWKLVPPDPRITGQPAEWVENDRRAIWARRNNYRPLEVGHLASACEENLANHRSETVRGRL